MFLRKDRSILTLEARRNEDSWSAAPLTLA